LGRGTGSEPARCGEMENFSTEIYDEHKEECISHRERSSEHSKRKKNLPLIAKFLMELGPCRILLLAYLTF
jgi:hypothetical protein